MTYFDPVEAPVRSWGYVFRDETEVPNEAARSMLADGLSLEQASAVLSFLQHEVIPGLLQGEARLRMEGFTRPDEQHVAAFVGPENTLDISMRGTRHERRFSGLSRASDAKVPQEPLKSMDELGISDAELSDVVADAINVAAEDEA